MNIKEAKALAFGSRPSVDLEEYYRAWQWLYDRNVELEQPDIEYMDKLICDGHITIDK
jgi:hypothetical protein